VPRIQGWGHRTTALPLAAKLPVAPDATALSHVRRAVLDAYGRAGLSGPAALDGVETHDCFTVSEYLAIEWFGVAAPGQAGRAIEAATVMADGALPFNPGGGLMGGGHPVGATGVRMLVDAARQVRGDAGATQVPGARRFGTLNIGGSGATAVALVVGVETGGA
jgi:acetyl-CoA C-acetyltransferase